MPKRNRKKFSRPRKAFDKSRIEEENELREKYGLKSKREIWKAESAIARIRNLAKQLITKSDEEKNKFIERLQKKGFNIGSIADTLALDKEDWLKRRLQTIVFSRGLAYKPRQARQLIVHKHVSIGEQIVNIPSYQVSLEEEPSVKLNIVLKVKEPKKSKMDEIKEEILEGESVENEEEVIA
jgi:small subunit ribosomal protein S4